MEAQNRKLSSELENLRAKWGIETAEIKRRYDQELKDARELLDQLRKEKAEVEIKLASLEDECDELRAK